MPYVYAESEEGKTIPGSRLGNDIARLPTDIEQLYNEARDAASVGAFSACAMVARKVLMNLAVREGAEENKTFQYYVKYLGDHGFIPPRGRGWVDRIRQSGNEATHEIKVFTGADARDVMHLLESLLRHTFEMADPPYEGA